jgi:hypothetical protein
MNDDWSSSQYLITTLVLSYMFMLKVRKKVAGLLGHLPYAYSSFCCFKSVEILLFGRSC